MKHTYRFYTSAIKSYENDLFFQMEDCNIPFKYSDNFFALKSIPSVEQFKQAIMIMDKKRINEAISFYFPINCEIPQTIHQYLRDEKFEIMRYNLYTMNTIDFPQKEVAGIKLKKVTLENNHDFVAYTYEESRRF